MIGRFFREVLGYLHRVFFLAGFGSAWALRFHADLRVIVMLDHHLLLLHFLVLPLDLWDLFVLQPLNLQRLLHVRIYSFGLVKVLRILFKHVYQLGKDLEFSCLLFIFFLLHLYLLLHVP
mmetsp:Transcript_19533/g.18650  ORF Transcript_19533/g.18650 Transcript_19533/m.18650 type:complete len:120 (-) Transcript_19533:661-1020(-)